MLGAAPPAMASADAPEPVRRSQDRCAGAGSEVNAFAVAEASAAREKFPKQWRDGSVAPPGLGLQNVLWSALVHFPEKN